VLKKIFKIGVLLVVLNAVYQVVPPYWRCQRFKSALQDLAVASHGRTDAVIIDDVLAVAEEHKIALEREWVTVSRAADRSHTYIEVTWAEPLTPFPGWKHTWVPEVKADGWHLRAPLREVR
jgi:hypothetical protein